MLCNFVNEEKPAEARSRRAFVDLTELSLFDWDKSNLCDDCLSGIAEGEIDKLFCQPAWIAVGVIKCRACVGIRFPEHALLGRHGAIDRHHFDSARLRVGETDIPNAVRVLAN